MSFCLRCYGFYKLFDKSFNVFDIWQVAFLGQSPLRAFLLGKTIENGTMGFLVRLHIHVKIFGLNRFSFDKMKDTLGW